MNHDISQLRGAVLKAVSRSFYLSIRLLPAQLRDPVALAYLLARATDTIADTTEIDAELRQQQLAVLARSIQGDAPAAGAEEGFRAFAKQQTNTAERALIEQLPLCLAWLESLPNAQDRADIRGVLAHIMEGQMLDVQRPVLQTAEELDRYTYLVAGCVGEFWTRVCFRHLPQFASKPEGEMLRLGVDYGKGLQLINILRDAGADQRAGRSYLPAEELHSLGQEQVLLRWWQRAEQGMRSGIEYSCAVHARRVRLATALPAIIGARTLVLLREAGTEVFQRKVKVPRAEVRRILLTLVANLVSRSTIQTLSASRSS
ncbi:MAG: squalene/phytoene synthase family protein [Chthoniobacterales bacterium]|nr:squalene/phytoene synthase family protein [Chthoniobacterales bacterium]